MKNTQRAVVNVRISDLEYWKGDFQLPANETYTLVIDYPFEEKRQYQVKTGKGMGFSGLLKQIGKAYDKTYADADKGNNGYWHGIEDLLLESVNVNHKKKIISLSVGS